MRIHEKKDGLYWLIPDGFFDPAATDPSHINRIYRSALGQVWMKAYNKTYDQLYGWYWYDDQDYVPTCEYCGSKLQVNPAYDGIHAPFNIYKYYSRCGNTLCKDLMHDASYRSSHVLAHMNEINSSNKRSDWIARSSRSRLINRGGTAIFYIARTRSNRYKFGVTTKSCYERWVLSQLEIDPYTNIHKLIVGNVVDIANLEYDLKSYNNWSEYIIDIKYLRTLLNCRL